MSKAIFKKKFSQLIIKDFWMVKIYGPYFHKYIWGEYIYCFPIFFLKIIFFTSSTWGDATKGLSHFYMKSSKIQSFERLHHHEVRTLGLKFRSRKEGLVRWEVDFIVLVFFLVSLWRLRLWFPYQGHG